MEFFGWLKRVKPMGKKLFRVYSTPENQLVDMIRSRRMATYTKCDLDSNSLIRILNIIAALMSAGKMQTAADFCSLIAEKCFGKSPENPYRLMFQSIAMIAQCEAKFYDLNFFQVFPQEPSLKMRYSLCQQSATGFMEMEPTVFKIMDLLTICEEFSHLSCFRQCHVNLFKNLAEIEEDENVDWFDRVKVLDSNILALINDSDVCARLCESEKEKKEFQQNLRKSEKSAASKNNNQYCFSWFNHLHLREICVRSAAAMEVLKSDQAYLNFVKSLPESQKKQGKQVKKPVRRLQPRNPKPEEEVKVQRISFGDDSGVVPDSHMLLAKKQTNSKPRVRQKRTTAGNIFSTDIDDLNYSIPLKDGRTFSELNAEKVKEIAYMRRQRERKFDGGGTLPIDPRKRMPSSLRRKIRMIVRKMMSEGRNIQKMPVLDDDLLNEAFPVSDDECSDDETAPKTFFRTETLETLRKKNARKFGKLNPRSETNPVLWWQNAKDELLTTRAIANHCVKMTGESSEPFSEFEKYMGNIENGGKLRDRLYESKRQVNCRAFDVAKETGSDDGVLLTMPALNPFKDLNLKSSGRKPGSIGLNSLLLQNLRRKCIDELLILLLIIKGQQQLQDGNVIRCVAYLMLIEFKFAVIAESYEPRSSCENNFDPYLMHLFKCLLAKFKLYSTDLFGVNCLNQSEELLLQDESEEFNLNEKCFEFCKQTSAYFFCICIRGRIVRLEQNELNTNFCQQLLNRDDVEKQHEFFFGLDNANKNNHLSSFWRTECMPIVSGLLHITNHSLIESIDSMSNSEALKLLEDHPGLSEQTKNWLKLVTKYGFLVQKPAEAGPSNHNKTKNRVPMLFQLPSNISLEYETESLVDRQDLEEVHVATTDFVTRKNDQWKQKCKADKENFGRTNRDCEYLTGKNMTFFGEAIEKDVYMVAVYKGQVIEQEHIETGMQDLCRNFRSQSGFITIRNRSSTHSLSSSSSSSSDSP